MAARGGNSTDKLLRIIRGAEGAGASGAGASGRTGKGGAPAASAGPGRRSRAVLRQLTAPRSAARKGGVVGVDIAPTGLRLAKMAHGADGPRLLGCREVPFGPKMGPDSPDFPAFLGRQLNEFLQGDKGLELWSLASSAQAELLHVNIPRVPPSRVSDTVYWTAQKERPFDPAQFVMDYEIQGDVDDKGIAKRRALVYLVPAAEVARVTALFASAGHRLAGLTISPLALQTIFRRNWTPGADRPCANVFIGRNWSRIDIFTGGELVLSRGVNTGLSSLADALAEGYNERLRLRAEAAARPAPPAPSGPLAPESAMELDLDLEILPEQDRPAGTPTLELELEPAPAMPLPEPAAPPARMDAETARQVLSARLLGGEPDPALPGAELDEAEVVELAGSAVHRLGRQLDRTFHHFSELHGGAVVEHMLFSGVVSSSQALLDALARDLGIPAELLDPLASDACRVGAAGLPGARADRLALNLVTGLALSDSTDTPNLLHTYKAKDRALQVVRQGNAVYAVFLALVLALAGVWFWQDGVARGKRAELGQLRGRIAAFQPVVDQNLLLNLAGDLGRKRLRLKDLSRRYEGLALFNELSALLPESVLLRNVSVELPGPAAAQAKAPAAKGAPAPAQAGFVVLDGQVAGDPEMYDARLAAFLIRLEGSPLFEGAVIHERQVLRPAAGGEVLRFVVHVRVRKEGAA